MLHLVIPKVGLFPKLVVLLLGSAFVASVIDGSGIYVPLWAALIVAISAIATPVINAISRSMSQKSNWKRQDEVANRVAEAARELKQANAKTIELAESTQTGIQEIHHMVDGQITSALQRDLKSKKVLLVTLKELIEIKKTKNIEPSQETLDEVASLEEEIKELIASIAERQRLVAEAKDMSKKNKP